MNCLWEFYIKYKSECFIFPTTNIDNKSIYTSQNFNKFNYIFDPSSYGIYMLGYDIIHSNNKI